MSVVCFFYVPINILVKVLYVLHSTTLSPCFREMDVITRLESQFDYDRVSSYMLRYWSASLFISAAYVVIIFSLQRWMKNRKPYKLQRWLFAWSTALTGISLIGLYRTGGFACKCSEKHVNVIELVQWTLSIDNTLGTQLAVLYREVSLIQSVLYREVPLYNIPYLSMFFSTLFMAQPLSPHSSHSPTATQYWLHQRLAHDNVQRH